ncbi:hypothetical protein niasHT_008984 [Heterodera trifolii]|uniref:Globin domain-containing protein n=1 Tax=Heterodera trifolii TaxID=157864 RepID=A0ABD2LY18_9BILA
MRHPIWQIGLYKLMANDKTLVECLDCKKRRLKSVLKLSNRSIKGLKVHLFGKHKGSIYADKYANIGRAKSPNMSTREEIQAVCVQSLKQLKIGVGEEELQNGKDFYKFFFTNYPTLRVYFKGAEKYEAEDVQKSERFEKQGQRILVAMHLVANVYSNEMLFNAYVRETVNRHRQFKMEPSLWKAFWTVWTGFMETKVDLTEQAKSAWMSLGEDFAEEALAHLKRLGIPH